MYKSFYSIVLIFLIVGQYQQTVRGFRLSNNGKFLDAELSENELKRVERQVFTTRRTTRRTTTPKAPTTTPKAPTTTPKAPTTTPKAPTTTPKAPTTTPKAPTTTPKAPTTTSKAPTTTTKAPTTTTKAPTTTTTVAPTTTTVHPITTTTPDPFKKKHFKKGALIQKLINKHKFIATTAPGTGGDDGEGIFEKLKQKRRNHIKNHFKGKNAGLLGDDDNDDEATNDEASDDDNAHDTKAAKVKHDDSTNELKFVNVEKKLK